MSSLIVRRLLPISVGVFLLVVVAEFAILWLFPDLPPLAMQLTTIFLCTVAGTAIVQYVASFSERLRPAAGAELTTPLPPPQQVEETLQYVGNLIDSSLDIIIAVDHDRRIIEFNKRAQEVFGYDKSEVLGRHIEVIYGDDEQSRQIHQAMLVNKSFAGEIINRKKNGELFPSFLSASVLVGADGRACGFMGISRDISERKKLEEALFLAATTDRLTGIYNRHKFEDLMAPEMERARRYQSSLALVIFDLDHFKRINDSFGHHAGDLVLREVAELVAAHIRKADHFCRWGGEEFTILVPETNQYRALEMIDKIRRLIAEHRFAHDIVLTISAGVTDYRSGETLDAFLQRADAALYRAKELGRNRVEKWEEG